MFRIVCLDQVVRNLMRDNNPPIGHCFNFSSAYQIVLVKLREESEICKDTTVAVERNSTSCLVVKYVNRPPWEIVDVRNLVK